MNEKIVTTPKRFPEALKLAHVTSSPNTTINLFDGDLELCLATGQRLSAPGVVEWRWLPHPSIRFALSALNQYPSSPSLPEAILDIPALSVSCQVFVINTRVGEGGVYYCGLLRSPALVGMDTDCDQVLFHLPNFFQFVGEPIRGKDLGPWACRLRLESDRWVIVLDQKGSAPELISGLKDQGGYAITHVGEFRRADGGHFRFDEADDALRAACFFLSFARGLWCGPVLASGRMNDAEIWQQWAVSRATPWRDVESWFPRWDPRKTTAKLSQAFRGFMQKWQDNLWKGPIQNAIHWYIESNIGAGGIEGAIVLTQAALELLSWLYLVEDPATARFSVTQFENSTASTRIQRLLGRLSIPVDIPEALTNLRGEATTLQASNGPEAFVKLRNAIVHPKKSKRRVVLDTSVLARKEAKELGLWYVEMALLRIFDYKGEYYQRFVSGSIDQARASVPWT